MAASGFEIDENAIHDVEADFLESVYIYLTEGNTKNFSNSCSYVQNCSLERLVYNTVAIS